VLCCALSIVCTSHDIELRVEQLIKQEELEDSKRRKERMDAYKKVKTAIKLDVSVATPVKQTCRMQRLNRAWSCLCFRGVVTRVEQEVRERAEDIEKQKQDIVRMKAEQKKKLELQRAEVLASVERMHASSSRAKHRPKGDALAQTTNSELPQGCSCG
jgi:hypothetical protein